MRVACWFKCGSIFSQAFPCFRMRFLCSNAFPCDLMRLAFFVNAFSDFVSYFSRSLYFCLRAFASEHLDILTRGHLDIWTIRHLDTQAHGHVDMWTLRHLKIRCLENWKLGHVDICEHPTIHQKSYKHVFEIDQKT